MISLIVNLSFDVVIDRRQKSQISAHLTPDLMINRGDVSRLPGPHVPAQRDVSASEASDLADCKVAIGLPSRDTTN